MERYDHQKIDPPSHKATEGRGKMDRYNHQQIEKKWRTKWERQKTWKVDLAKAKKPYYNLMMFPYPSAEGLHVGNVYAFVGSDIHGRFARMRGNDVFEPMGFDSFGIHSENFAIKQGTHPKEQTAKNIKNFTLQLKHLGGLFDWEHSVTTSEPEYYKWTQWLFLQLYKAGLAYKKEAPVEWCPSCKTVLANEQVIDGKCERCNSEVIQKELEQWFFGITKYAERLLKNLEWIDWTEKTKIAQRNWIGKSEGLVFTAPVKNSKLHIQTFSAHFEAFQADTFVVIAPDHPLLETLIEDVPNKKEILSFSQKIVENREKEGYVEEKKFEGIFTGRYIVDPVGNGDLPIWVASYAIKEYGTGIVKCSAHDERDFAFAKKYGIRLKPVLFPKDKEQKVRVEKLEECYTDMLNGYLAEPNEFSGKRAGDARQEVIKYVIRKGLAEPKTQYHLRDWLISRQRYWGPPIPIIYCRKCWEIRNPKSGIRNLIVGHDYTIIEGKEHMIVPVKEKDLPVLLPDVEDFRPSGTGKSPLASVASFVETTCPECKGPAKRETDVSDTFLDSAWYFLRYPSVEAKNSVLEIRNSKLEIPWNQQITRRWLPLDMYIGGHEHAVLHLLYTRFITMALKDMGHIEFEEPFKKFRAHGLITKEGAKMSKSKGNVVNPDEYFVKYGADTVRTYLMFIGPLGEGGDWSDKGIVGISRFFNRLWSFAENAQLQKRAETLLLRSSGVLAQGVEIEAVRHRTIKKVTEDLEGLRYNTAIAALMEYSNEFSKKTVTLDQFNALLILLSPFAPHLTEELWEKLGNEGSVHNQPWPEYDPKALEEKVVRLVIQVNGKVRDVVEVSPGIKEKEAVALALAQEKIQKWFPTKKPKNVVFVKGRLLNLVSY
ncbi:MAG: class I tRNA ligase family protein [bacterium]|nr:class I tRNA ligase family protein [bacterium]